MVHSGVGFIFLNNGGAPKRRGVRGSLPPLPHPLDGPTVHNEEQDCSAHETAGIPRSRDCKH